MPAYMIGEIEVIDSEAYKAYSALVPATLEKYGGRFIVRGGKAHPMEGEWPERRRVVIEFPSIEAARQWWDSPEYARPKEMRRAASRGRIVFLEGV
jgi:uncharacterized protein (DUF1330 family)